MLVNLAEGAEELEQLRVVEQAHVTGASLRPPLFAAVFVNRHRARSATVETEECRCCFRLVLHSRDVKGTAGGEAIQASCPGRSEVSAFL